MPKYAARADANQPYIVRALREVGATVLHIHMVGRGCPDILVGYRLRNYLLEIKTETGTLTESEASFHDEWCGQVNVVRNADEALAVLGIEVL